MYPEERSGSFVICRDSSWMLSIRSVESGRRICFVHNSDDGAEHARQIEAALGNTPAAVELLKKCQAYFEGLSDRHAGTDALAVECEHMAKALEGGDATP